MLIPTIMAAIMGEWVAFRSFIFTLLLIAISVLIMILFARSWTSTHLGYRDVYFFVTLTWIIASALGAMPLYLSGTTGDYSSAFMEVMSGFTTTGLTTLTDIEAHPASILFWRSLTHWLGGMGIIVLFVAMLPALGAEGFQLFGAEAVGPIKSKLTPKIRDTALVLWLIYLGLSLIETLLLFFGGLSLYDALTVTFGSMATGGFVTKNASIGSYASPYVDVVVTIFMVLAGLNFSLYFAIIRGKGHIAWKDTEMHAYLAIYGVATLLITFDLIMSHTYTTLGESLRYGAFHSASIMTTTGFSTANYDTWPDFSRCILLFLMFIGGCSGSTGGGIKVSRIVTMFKLVRQNVKTLLHPKGVFSIHVEKERIPWRTVNAIAGFLLLYLALVLASMLVVASTGYDLTSSLAAGLISMGNIGLGLEAVGPAGIGFGPMAPYAKWFLSFVMLAGRLEIYTVLVVFTPEFWRHHTKVRL